MRKLALVIAMILTLGITGVALADPPDSDPTCGNPGGPASGQECAGDNGNAGCQGINTADDAIDGTPAEEPSDDALDLVRSILEAADGNENDECE